MKNRILYIFCLSLLSLSALAQIPRGSSMVGGSISGSHRETMPVSPYATKMKTTTVDVQPSYGQFVIDNFSVGIAASARFDQDIYYTPSSSTELTSKTWTYSVGPFVRYYVPITQKFYAFADASYALQWVRSDSDNRRGITGQDAVVKERTSSWGLGAGVSYFLTPNAALEVGLGYTRDRRKDTETDFPPASEDKNGTFGLSIGFNIFFLRAD